MEKQHFSVTRVVTHTKENISKFEKYSERKNTTYSNTNIVAERTPMNIYFKRYDTTLNQNFVLILSAHLLSVLFQLD